MILAAFIILVLVSIILGVFYLLTKHSPSWQSIVLKCLPVLSTAVLALVSANLASSYGAATLMITIALSILVTFEAFKCANQSEKAAVYFLSSANFAAILLLTFACVSMTNFLPWGLLAGLFLGLGIAFVIRIVKKDWAWGKVCMVGLNLMATFAFMLQAVGTILATKTIISAMLLLLSALFLSVHILLEIFATDTKTFVMISNALRILALILAASSIYFL